MEETTFSSWFWFVGRRVERLLLAGALLVVLALAGVYFALAARHYTEDRMSRGLEALALLIDGDEKVLQRFHDLETQRQKLSQKKKDAGTENFYVKALEDKVARAAASSGADPHGLRGVLSDAQAPAELAQALRQRKKAMDERPARVGGVAVPGGSLGMRLPAALLANAFVIALAPLIIVWLGALDVTRRRERESLRHGAEPYPHALNADCLPLEAVLSSALGGRWRPLESPQVRNGLLAFFRMALLALLVAPMIAAYVATVVTLGMATEGGWLRWLYAAVVTGIMLLQGTALLAGEAPAPATTETATATAAAASPGMSEP